MASSIVKGMPYGTMQYNVLQTTPNKDGGGDDTYWYPTVASEIALASDPIVDGTTKLTCLGGNTNNNKTSNNETKEHHHNRPQQQQQQDHRVKVEREIQLYFAESDFTWLVFVSRPVTVQCVIQPDTGGMQLQVVDDEIDTIEEDIVQEDGCSSNKADTNSGGDKLPFFIRIALTKICTSNNNPIYCHNEQMIPYSLNLGQGRYDDLLRNHSHLIPGPDTSFDYVIDQTKQEIHIEFDWDVKDMRNYAQPAPKDIPKEQDLIVFALPHHLDLMGTRYAPGYLKYCASTLIGPACLLAGSKWNMVEHLPQIDFRAPRPPAPWAIPALAQSVQKDISYTLPRFYRRGAGDTYFSGKLSSSEEIAW